MHKIDLSFEDDDYIAEPLKNFEVIKKMRADLNAPVDTMGCEIQADLKAPIQTQYF